MRDFDTRRVLIVDDNAAIHDDFRKIFRPKSDGDADLRTAEAAMFGDDDGAATEVVAPVDFELDYCFQGEEALGKVKEACENERPYAVAFVDMRMPPGWDGLHTIDELWKVAPDLQVVMCTAYSDHSWNEICHRLGRTDKLLILKKPFDAVEVSQSAVALIEKWRLQKEADYLLKNMESLVQQRTHELKQAEVELQRRNQQLVHAAAIADLGYWTYEIAQDRMSWSPNTYRMLNVDQDAFEPTLDKMVELFNPSDRQAVFVAISQAIQQQVDTDFDATLRREADDDVRYFHTKIRCERDESGETISLFGATQDVTEHERAILTIKHAALHDPLTQLPNRAKFHDRLSTCLNHTKRGGMGTALILLDLDNFKEINDSLGHPTGDKLLKELAVRLEGCVQEIDLVARLGGDEFAIVQTEATLPKVTALLDQIQSILRTPFTVDGQVVHTNCSAGVAIAPHDGLEADKLLKNADMALYKAKNDGRGVYRFFEKQMDTQIRKRREIETELRTAIKDENFEIHYQPIVNSQSESISCVEALLRWRHPEKGLLPPCDFIPVAEASGLIVPIGEWVLRKACDDAANWPSSINVAVNVSVVQFLKGSLFQAVLNALTASGLDPTRLELEITETIFLDDTEQTLEVLHLIRDLGVRIVMDDFGVGYSSLSYLRSFPFDKLKLDRSFLQDAETNVESQAIISAVAGLGNSLGMTTTAEGVETDQQLQRICEDGYSQMQGFLLGKPQPIAEIQALFAIRDECSQMLSD